MIIDYTTKNKSFLEMAVLLKEKGIKNNKFFLTLYNDSLQGVDPHSKKLTSEQKLNIYYEICSNPWYFLREVVRVPADGGSIPYKLHLGNLAMSYLKYKNKNQISILCRQAGKTMGCIIFDMWSICFRCENANFLYLNKQFPDAKKNLKIFKDLKERLPEWLLKLITKKDDKDNEESKLISYRNNSLTAKPAANNPQAADNLGRGLTTSNIMIDEMAFLKYNKIIYNACRPAFDAAAHNAKLAGKPYGITILTTPNNREIEHAAFCYSLIENAARFRLECFDMSDEELDDYIDKNSVNMFVFVQFTYKEIGKTDEWLKEQIRQSNNDLANIKRELLLEWPTSTESSVFSEEQLDKIRSFVREPILKLNIKNYFIDFYEQPDFKANYILSVDVGGGLSHDASTITFAAPDDFRVIGDFNNNKIDVDSMKEFLRELISTYFRNAVLIIERNSFGLAIVQALMKDPAVEPRMYRDVKEQIGEKKTHDGFVVRSKNKNIVYGFDTTTSSRKLMMELLPSIVDDDYDKIISPKLFKDIQGLERKPNGKIEAIDGGHDDNLMSFLIGRYCIHYNKLRDRFNINSIPSSKNRIDNSNKIPASIKMANYIDMANNTKPKSLNKNPYDDLINIEQNNIENQNKKVANFLNILNMNK